MLAGGKKTVYKSSISDGELIIKSKLAREEIINPREWELLSSGSMRGIMKVKKGSFNRLIFTAPESEPLKRFLMQGLTKEEFASVLAQLVRVLMELDQYALQMCNLELHIESVYITPRTRELIFIYRPVMNKESCKNYTPEECSIYIVDCGGMALKSFESSNHVGGVVLANEEERMSNLFKMMANLIQQRKEIFSAKGLGTYSAYVEAGFYSNIAGSKELQKKLNDILKLYGRLKVAVVFGAVENMPINYNSPELLKYIKENNKTFMFEDIGGCKFVDVTSRDIMLSKISSSPDGTRKPGGYGLVISIQAG